jgi:hypothetical protein
MATLLPKAFMGGKGPLTNFDFYDATYGSGYKTFYLLCSDNSAGDQFFLSTENLYSSYQKTYMGGALGDETQDFDLLFNNSMTVKGEAIFSYCVTTQPVTHCNVTINVYHVRGVTETSIGTATHSELGTGLTAAQQLLKVSLTTKQFAKGDKLRVEVVATRTAGDGNQFFIYIGQDSTSVRPFKAMIPFKIDL